MNVEDEEIELAIRSCPPRLLAYIRKLEAVRDAAAKLRTAQSQMVERGNIENCDGYDAAQSNLYAILDAQRKDGG